MDILSEKVDTDEDKISKSEDDNFIQKYLSPITFGLDEQLITLCAVLSGYLSFPQKRIIIALIIMAFSNSLPDTLSYYENKVGNGQEKELALRESAIVFSSEIISTFIVILPILFIKDTKISIILSYVIIFTILIFVNYYKNKDILSAISKLPIYILIGFIIWFISTMSQKYLKISI